MTIKPQNGITSKPLNASSTVSDVLIDNITVATTPYVESTTEAIKNSTTPSLDTAANTENSVASESTTHLRIPEEPITRPSEVPEVPVTAPPVANVTNCKKGFIPNQKGGCDYKLQSASNA
jgi:hypothetical protein